MKTCYNIPLALCHRIIREKLFSEFAAYIMLQLHTDGILPHREAMQLISGLDKLSSSKSRKKCLLNLEQLGWVGYDRRRKRIYLRSIVGIQKANDARAIRVARLNKKDIPRSKSFVYAAILSERLQQQKSAIFFQSRKKSAANKYDAAKQTDYTGLGKYGLASLFHCSPGQAVKIKDRLIKDGYLLTKKRRVKVLTIPKADMKMKSHLDAMFPGNSAKMSFVRNKSGAVDIYQQLHDEMKSKLVVKKRPVKYSGIRNLSSG